MKRTGNNNVFEDINSILLNSILNEVCFFHKTLSEWACMRVCACAWVCMRVCACVNMRVCACVNMRGSFAQFWTFPKNLWFIHESVKFNQERVTRHFQNRICFFEKPKSFKKFNFPAIFWRQVSGFFHRKLQKVSKPVA